MKEFLTTQEHEPHVPMESYKRFSAVQREADLREKGSTWYRNRFSGGFNYKDFFSYVSAHPEALVKFPQTLRAIVEAQMAVQSTLDAIQHTVDTDTQTSTAPEADLKQLETAQAKLVKLKRNFSNQKDPNVRSQTRQAAVEAFNSIKGAAYGFAKTTQQPERPPVEIVTVETKGSEDALSLPDDTDVSQVHDESVETEYPDPDESEDIPEDDTKYITQATEPETVAPTDDVVLSEESTDADETKQPLQTKTSVVTSKNVTQQRDQMSRLVAKTRNIAREGNMTVTEASAENEEFASVRGKIGKSRYRLTQIEADKDIVHKKEEVQQLRDQMAQDLQEFRKLRWSQANTQETDGQQAVAPVELTAGVEETLALKTRWREKKEAYEEAYRAHLHQRKTNRFAFWKKEGEPQELTQAQQAYQQARAQYALSLDTALGVRLKKRTHGGVTELSEQSGAARAALAKRFVVEAAQAKLSIEKENIAQTKAGRIFESAAQILTKNRKTVKVLGYVVAIGVGTATGALATTLLGKQFSAKAAVAGSAVGALGAGALYNAVLLNPREARFKNTKTNTLNHYSTDNIEALEAQYEHDARKYESAQKNKKYAVAAGAIAGGVAASSLLGHLDVEEVVQQQGAIPETLDTPEALPETVTSVVTEEANTPNIEITEEPRVAQLTQVESVPEPNLAEVEPEPDRIAEVDVAPEAERGGIQVDSHELESRDTVVTISQSVEEQSQQAAPDRHEPVHTEVTEVTAAPFTFETGNNVDTVSEALFESWKDNPDLLDDTLTKKEFLSEMYAVVAELESNPHLNAELMEKMGITSMDIHNVQVGQTINMQPFFEYMESKK